MLEQFSRTSLLLGEEGIDKLSKSTVAIFGVGGVGSFTVEALARCGVGNLVLIDNDDICITNVNRQLHATCKTIGQMKVEVMKERILDINPNCNVTVHKAFYTEENGDELIKKEYDCVVDAIDTISSKLDMIERCTKMGIPIISSMGAGNKLDPTRFEITDIFKTSVCPLAKVMRRELKNRGIKKLKVVYSKEEPIKITSERIESFKENIEGSDKVVAPTVTKRQTPGSISFVPSVVGLIIASEVVRDILK